MTGNRRTDVCAVNDGCRLHQRHNAGVDETYDHNGNPIWKCECHIVEEDCCFDGTSSSKKEAKKDSAFRMLFYVLGMEGE